MSSELSEKTMVKIPIALAITICIGLIGFGGTYTKLVSTTEKLETLEQIVSNNELLDRSEREKIRKEESDRHREMLEWFQQYLQDEVGGLRADWERDRIEQNRRLNNLEK